jgi:cardiolipin synthase
MPDAASERLHRFRTAPNLLTLSRICLAPFLVSAILDNHYALSFGLFVVAGLTDLLDGLLARLLKQYTMLGQYLDPVADKLLLSTLFLVLTYKNLIPARVTAMVLGRDVGILVVAAILYATVGRREFRPSLVGKCSTLAQIAAVAAVLFQAMLLDHHVTVRAVAIFEQWALWATMALAIASGLHYSWIAVRRVGAQGANGNGHIGHNGK